MKQVKHYFTDVLENTKDNYVYAVQGMEDSDDTLESTVAKWDALSQNLCGRLIGLMVSALDSRSKGLGSNPGWVMCCVLGQDTLLLQCLPPPRSINGYRQTAREAGGGGGGNLRWTSIPSRRSSNTETGISSG